MKYNDIINAFEEHIKNSGCRYYSDMYIGITNNADRRFEEHHVSKDTQWWISALADSEEIARDVERHFLEMGMRGDTGGGSGDGSAKYVYSYNITPNTIE